MILVGALGLAISFWGLYYDIGFIAQPFYAWAWWSYIFLLDGFVARRRGSSLLTTRRKHLPSVMLWSITFWYFFELLNLRYQNWYYVGVFGIGSIADMVGGIVFGTAAFATVFTGLFETYEALTALELFNDVKLRPRSFAPWVTYAVQAVGAAMVTLSLAFSYYLAPLVWGSLSFLVDPWNYRRGARSILADIEHGNLGVLLRLLFAGLACGLVWESFNFLAPQKWIYTVRGLEEVKLFEMPVLGFLGFPALALDAFAAYAAIAYGFLGNTTWENPDDVSQPLEARGRLSTKALVALVPLHLAFWGSIGLLTMTRNIGSIELQLHHLETLPFGAEAFLETEDIVRPRQLLKAIEDPESARRVQAGLELTDTGLEALYHEAQLLTHKGIGYHHGQVLRRLGYRRVDDLAAADATALYQQLDAQRQTRFPGLRPGMVRVWVNAARDVTTSLGDSNRPVGR